MHGHECAQIYRHTCKHVYHMHMKTEELLVAVVALITAIFSYYIIQCNHEVALLSEAVVSLMNDGWCHKAIPGQAFHLNLRRIIV